MKSPGVIHLLIFLILKFVLAYSCFRASLVVQMIKNLPAVQGTGVQSLGREDPLEKGMAAHSSLLAWNVPRTEESGGRTPGQT